MGETGSDEEGDGLVLSGKDRGVLRTIEELLSEEYPKSVSVADVAARQSWDPAAVAQSFHKLMEADCVESDDDGAGSDQSTVVTQLTRRGRRQRDHRAGMAQHGLA